MKCDVKIRGEDLYMFYLKSSSEIWIEQLFSKHRALGLIFKT